MPDPSQQVTAAGRYGEGRAVRREVLGDNYVEQANAKTTDFTRDFQQIVTEFAWGTIWTRPGLDRRSRLLITLTACRVACRAAGAR
jgi:alkylhydroperoxidase/carboxymuconolactone decarboxylase family protein YurZ